MQQSNFFKIEALLAAGLLLFFPIESTAQQPMTERNVGCQLCPTIVVESNSIGRTMFEFKAVVSGIAKDLRVGYRWTISNAELVSGQGSARVTVKPNPGKHVVTAAVKVEGLDLACDSTASESRPWEPPPEAQLVDEYSRLPFEISGPEPKRVQNPTSAQDEDWPSLEYLRSDYKSVAIVAHVLIREAEITGRVGGYENWRIVCEVLESLKGTFKKGDTIEYFHGAEAGFKKESFTGEKIVFLLKEYDKTNKSYRYLVLENSTLPPAAGTLKKLRTIKRAGKRVRQ
jgi:hypothetical protein